MCPTPSSLLDHTLALHIICTLFDEDRSLKTPVCTESSEAIHAPETSQSAETEQKKCGLLPFNLAASQIASGMMSPGGDSQALPSTLVSPEAVGSFKCVLCFTYTCPFPG